MQRVSKKLVALEETLIALSHRQCQTEQFVKNVVNAGLASACHIAKPKACRAACVTSLLMLVNDAVECRSMKLALLLSRRIFYPMARLVFKAFATKESVRRRFKMLLSGFGTLSRKSTSTKCSGSCGTTSSVSIF